MDGVSKSKTWSHSVFNTYDDMVVLLLLLQSSNLGPSYLHEIKQYI